MSSDGNHSVWKETHRHEKKSHVCLSILKFEKEVGIITFSVFYDVPNHI